MFLAAAKATLSNRRFRRGFTLVELLVVIAIVGVLAAMTMTALARAKDEVRSIGCLSNLRQLGLGWQMYADENHDVMVPGRFGRSAGGAADPADWYSVGNGFKYRPRWIAAMGSYVGLHGFTHPTPGNERQDYDSALYVCPVVRDWKDERNSAYGYNHQFLGNARVTAGRFHNFPVKRSRLSSPARTVVAGDSLGTAAGLATEARQAYQNNGNGYAELGNHGWTLDPPRLTEVADRGTGDAGSPRTAVDARHGGKAVVVFGDGHTERLSPGQLGYQTLSSGAYADAAGVNGRAHNALFAGTGVDDDPPSLP